MKIQHRNRLEKRPGEIPEKLLAFTLIMAPVFSLLCIAFGLWLLAAEPAALWLILLGIVGLIWNWADIQSALAVYSFSDAGVEVKYPLEKCRMYTWEEFQQVCVCYHSRATEMYGYSVLCLVKKGEKKDAFGRWKTASPLHYRRVMCLDYSEELLDTVKKSCPLMIPDLRDRGNYCL